MKRAYLLPSLCFSFSFIGLLRADDDFYKGKMVRIIGEEVKKIVDGLFKLSPAMLAKLANVLAAK
jgi:hypothetical protein